MGHKPEKSHKKEDQYKKGKSREEFRQKVVHELGALVNSDAVWDSLTKFQKDLMMSAQNFLSVGISDEGLDCFLDFYIQQEGEGPHGP